MTVVEYWTIVLRLAVAGIVSILATFQPGLFASRFNGIFSEAGNRHQHLFRYPFIWRQLDNVAQGFVQAKKRPGAPGQNEGWLHPITDSVNRLSVIAQDRADSSTPQGILYPARSSNPITPDQDTRERFATSIRRHA